MVANRLGEDGIGVRALVTFDAHDFNDEGLRLEHDNVANGVNFYTGYVRNGLGQIICVVDIMSHKQASSH